MTEFLTAIRRAERAVLFAGVAALISYSLVLPNSVLAQGTQNISPTAGSPNPLEQAQIEYYQVRTSEIRDKWKKNLDRFVPIGGFIIGIATAIAALLQWRNSSNSSRESADLSREIEGRERETLRDGQFLDQLKRLSEKDNSGARESAAIVIAFLSLVDEHLSVELSNILLDHAERQEHDGVVRNTINRARRALQARLSGKNDDDVFAILYGQTE